MQISQLKKSYGIDELPIKNRQEFIKFLMNDAHIRRKIGLEKFKKVLNFYRAKILYYNDEIKLHVEFSASDYAKKNMRFGNVDLLITFVRNDLQIVKGVPIWSFYRKINNRYVLTINEDIKTDFDMLGEFYYAV